jgi:hypothetical protein
MYIPHERKHVNHSKRDTMALRRKEEDRKIGIKQKQTHVMNDRSTHMDGVERQLNVRQSSDVKSPRKFVINSSSPSILYNFQIHFRRKSKGQDKFSNIIEFSLICTGSERILFMGGNDIIPNRRYDEFIPNESP